MPRRTVCCRPILCRLCFDRLICGYVMALVCRLYISGVRLFVDVGRVVIMDATLTMVVVETVVS